MNTRTKAACLRSIEVDGLHTFKPTTPLAKAVRAAIAAEDAVDYTADEYALHRAEGAAIDARVALRRELESFGLSVSEISRMGSLL